MFTIPSKPPYSGSFCEFAMDSLYWADCRRHREEASELAGSIADSSVRLIPMSYQKLWEEWELSGPLAHLRFLKVRYNRAA
jgi:hypothetical protein